MKIPTPFSKHIKTNKLFFQTKESMKRFLYFHLLKVLISQN